MSKRRRLEELTIKNNFMFAAVMSKPENCIRLLEMVLHVSIDRIEVITEKSIVYHPEYHGIRLDVFVKDENHTRYSIEMQVSPTPIQKRSRYYHSEIDSDLLLAGASYEQLPDTYVIFICDYDPFGARKYCYTVKKLVRETGETYHDGSHTVILSTRGTNRDEVAPEMVSFLNYVHADLEESTEDFKDDYVRQLQESVQEIKTGREMKMRDLVMEMLMQQERNEGREEGREEGRLENMTDMILDVLSDLGEPSDELRERLAKQDDLEKMKQWFHVARKSHSIEEFEACIVSGGKAR